MPCRFPIFKGLSLMRLALAALTAALTLGSALANVPPPQPGPEGWRLGESDVLTLEWGADDGIAIICPEGKKVLEITATPQWETGYTMENGKIFDGSLDEVTVSFGKVTFPATLVPKAADQKEEDYFPTYTLAATTDSVTAIMLADNVTITLKSDPDQVREGTPDASGAFDTFATTCAQINGLK